MKLLKVFLPLAVALILLFGGLYVYNRIASSDEAKAYPPPGQLVQVDDHKLHLFCTGAGSPAVILESGLGDWSLSWRLVQPEIAKFARVCSYDRAGLGWSELGPEPRTSLQITRELNNLLANAGLTGPVVLVGHSAGGAHARVFASRFPEQVAGLVLLDAPDEMAVVPAYKEQMKQQALVMALLSKLGIFRLVGLFDRSGSIEAGSADFLPAYVHRLSPDDCQRYLVTSLNSFSALASEWDGFEQSLAQLREAAPLKGIPVTVLSSPDSGEGITRTSPGLPAETAYRQVENSGHHIQIDQPQIVIAAIEAVVNKARQANP